MMEKIPKCELGDKIENHECNKRILSKFGLDAFKVRPCEWYYDEYKDCKKLKSKFRDLYVSGFRTDCMQWYSDYKYCMEFRKDRTTEPFAKVLKSEKIRVDERRKASKKNDVWKYRTEPPKDFNAEIDHMPRSSTYSPFEMYENIKKSRKKKPPGSCHTETVII